MQGAFDPLDRIADVCEKHKLWMHVDVSTAMENKSMSIDQPWFCEASVFFIKMSENAVLSVLLCVFRVLGEEVCSFPSNTNT